MTKEDYWQAHVARNPRFKNEENKIQLTVKMLRRLMEEAYDKGSEHIHKPAKRNDPNASINDLFKDLFGVDMNTSKPKI